MFHFPWGAILRVERGSLIFVHDKPSAADDLTLSHLSLIVTPLPLPATSRDIEVSEKPW